MLTGPLPASGSDVGFARSEATRRTLPAGCRRLLLSILPFALLGLVLRFWGLHDLVLVGDELHAARAALSLPVGSILETFGVADYSLPLTALARLQLDLGIPLSETTLRAPSLVAGVGLLVLIPLLVARTLGARTALFFSALAAVSPWLVLYSRIARPYAAATLICLAAVLLFADSWSRGTRSGLVAWSLGAVLAAWVLPVVAPFVLAPPLLALIDGRGQPGGRLGAARRLALPVALAAVLGALAYVPTLPSFRSAVAIKLGRGSIPLSSWPRAGHLLAGVDSGLLAAAFGLVALAGFALWPHAGRPLRFHLASASLLQAVAVRLAMPAGAGSPDVLARYLLALLPVAILGAAVALDNLCSRLRARSSAASFCCALLVSGALFSAGPLPRILERPTTFAAHPNQLRFTDSRFAAARPLPAIYDCPAVARASARVEAPVPARSFSTHETYEAAVRSRRRVVLATPEPDVDPPRTQFRTLVGITPRELLDADAGALVLHLRPDLDPLAFAPDGGASIRPVGRRLLEAAREAADRLRTSLVASWGPPDCDDGSHLAWDLERLRSPASAGPAER